MHRLLREPFVHFLSLGAALFALHALVSPRGARPADARRIVVTPADLRRLRDEHFRLVGKMPSETEERAIVERFVDDEVLYREGLALGLDRGDLIVRGRVAQKMQFLAEDMVSLPEPSDAELAAHLAASNRFREPARVTFRHAFLSRERHRTTLAVDAERMLARLRQAPPETGAPPGGEPFLPGSRFARKTPRDLASIFGADFARQVLELPAGEWSGPVASSYGLHVVFVEARTPERQPPLAEVRERVRRAWLSSRRREANRALINRLRARYRIEGAPAEATGAYERTSVPSEKEE